MEFDNDIFISYAHIDNQPLAEGQAGWISSFHRALEVRVAQLLGKEARIWRDPKLAGNDVFADQLVDRLLRVALLVSVFSPRYLRSDWCTRELAEFCRAAEKSGGLRVGNRARVFKVVKTPVPREEHPAAVQELLGYEFYAVDPQSGRAKELQQGRDPDLERLYWAKLDDLAHDICELLAEMESGAVEEAAAEPVYLAETSFDLQEHRDAVRRELRQRGFTVLPDRALPLVAAECESFVRSEIGRCRLSIHMVGENYGIVPDGGDRSVVALQHALAAERSAAGELSRLIWLPPGLDAGDERQRQFVEALRTDPEAQRGADLLETPFEDFKTILARKLEALEEPAEEEAQPPPAGPAEAELTRIYLICDQRDLGETQELEDHLFDQGFEVILPVFEGDEAQVRLDHQENLILCDAVVLFYGRGNELWLRRKLREVTKSAGYGRQRALFGRAIYVAPPLTPAKERLRTREALVLDTAERFSPEVLSPFLAQIASERERLAG